MIQEKTNFERFLAFMLGLSICEGISVVFSFGNTMFTISEVISPIIMFFLFLTKANEFSGLFKNIPTGFKLFFIIVIFSIVPGVLYFGIDALYRYMVGLVYISIIFTMTVNVYVLRQSRHSMILGIAIGLVLNVIFSLICFFAFNSGKVISLEGVFPRDHFFTPTLTFRTQGFFLEPSHFIRFVGSVILIAIANIKIKNSIFIFFLTLATIFVMMYSFSGSIVILAFGMLIYWIFSKSGSKSKITVSSVATLLFALVLVALIIFNPDVLSNLESIFLNILSGADITDEGNAARFDSMKTVFENIDVATLGCGWNLSGTLFEARKMNIVSAFSYILQMAIELGFLGALIYCVSLIQTSLKLIKQKNTRATALGASLLIILALQIGTDYSLNTCTMAVFGLVICELEEIKINSQN